MLAIKSKNTKNFMSVLGANLLVMLIGIIQSLIFPKLMSPNQYGIWSLYLLYVSYAGLFNLGVSDGIYLLYGGENYDNLDKSKFKTYLIIIVSYLLVFLVIWSLFQIKEGMKEQVLLMLMIGVSCFLACLINFTTMIDQATSRFNIYSKGHIIEKILIMLGAICLFKWRSAFVIIISSIIGRMVTVIYYYLHTKPILIAKHSSYREAFKDIRKFSSVGIWVTLAAICTTSMTGIGRFFVKNFLGVTELGYYSFVLSIAGLFTIFFSAIATVLFPMMRQSSGSVYKKQVDMMDSVLDFIGLFILLLYYPSRVILEMLYPQYKPGFDCLILLFPLVLLQGRTTMIHFTVYKVERFEQQYVYNLLISMVLCACVCCIGMKFWPNTISIAIATYIAFLFWSNLNIFVYNRNSINKLSYHCMYTVVSIVFLLVNLMIKRSMFVHITLTIGIVFVLCRLMVLQRCNLKKLKNIRN